MPENWQINGFGIYIHWPFCQAKCPYCDFNSHVAASIEYHRWRAAFLSELDRMAQLTDGRLVRSIFFGGGTPSLMPVDLVASILDRIAAKWPVANDMEVTLEANPTSADAERFRGYHGAGVNRLSMGVQALQDADLRRLGRLHTVEEAIRAFELARQTFHRVSFDLIYARQDQSLASWEKELRLALSMAVDHLSLYQLTIEEGTAFGDRHAKGGLKGLPDEDLSADMYLLTQSLCEQAGMPAYEVSNHARDEAMSRHNLIYWRGGDYIGIGPGAHGRFQLGNNRIATESPKLPSSWLSLVEAGDVRRMTEARMDPVEIADENLLMGIRLVEGLDLKQPKLPSLNRSVMQQLESEGFIQISQDRLFVTTEGRLMLNQVIRRLATG